MHNHLDAAPALPQARRLAVLDWCATADSDGPSSNAVRTRLHRAETAADVAAA